MVSLIQARLSSTRLPGKVLMPLGAGTVLDQVILRARQFSDQVVVCTSVDESDDPIEAHCEAVEVMCVRGPLDDVFWRFRLALANEGVLGSEWFARITADCPLLSVEQAWACIERVGDDVDYIGVDPLLVPRGLTVELVRRSVFEALDRESLDHAEREHVTLHLYEQTGRYRCARVEPIEGLGYPEFRLTLDYREDYELLLRLFADHEITAIKAVARLRQDWALAAINATCEQKAARPIKAS